MKRALFAITLLLFTIPIGFADTEVIFGDISDYAKTNSDLRFIVRANDGGEPIRHCNPGLPSEESCISLVEVSWLVRYSPAILEEMGRTECPYYPASGGLLFKCVLTAPSEPGEYEATATVSVDNWPNPDSKGGLLGRHIVIVYECGDDVCTGPETQESCCSDCGAPDLKKCEVDKLVDTCGNGLYEPLYGETVNNCCIDSGCSLLKSCTDNGCELNRSQISMALAAIIVLGVLGIIFYKVKINKR